MTQERFLQILEDPDLLAGISYEELKTLALAYPATHNLRVLLALKAQQIGHPESKKQLAAAAAYSLDRSRLFSLMAPEQLAPQPVSLREEVLELKPIADIRKALEVRVPAEKPASASKARALEADRTEQPAGAGAAPMAGTDNSAPELPEKAYKEPTLTFEAVPEDGGHWVRISNLPALEPADKLSKRENSDTHEAESEAAPPAAKVVAEIPADPSTRSAASQEKKDEKTDIASLSAQELAERSVTLREEVVSETLARLLAKQGYKEKSIAMYEKLGLIFPEKSDYFAAEIQKLKK